MKAFILLILSLIALQAHADPDAGRFGIDLAGGLFSNYGLVGGGLRYFVSDWEDIHAVTGVDFEGFVGGLGTRFYVLEGDTCLFFIPCQSRVQIGLTALHYGGATISATDQNAVGTYKVASSTAGSLTIGTYDSFSRFFNLGLEIGYRYFPTQPGLTKVSGAFTANQQTTVQKEIGNSVSAALTIGFLF